MRTIRKKQAKGQGKNYRAGRTLLQGTEMCSLTTPQGGVVRSSKMA